MNGTWQAVKRRLEPLNRRLEPVNRRWMSAKPVVLPVAAAVLAVLAAAGLVILTELFSRPLDRIPPIAAGLFVVMRVVAHFVHARALAFTSRWLGAVFVPILTLLAVDAAWADAIDRHPPPLLGLVIAGLVIGFAIWVYLQTWWTPDKSDRPLFWSFFFVALLVIAPPLLAWSWNEMKGGPGAIQVIFGLVVVAAGIATYVQSRQGGRGDLRPRRWRAARAGLAVTVVAPVLAWTWGVIQDEDRLQPQQPVSRLDVVTINGGRGAVGRSPVDRGWSVEYWRGRVAPASDAVLWGRRGAPPERARERADRVLVLLPDGAPSLRRSRSLPDLEGERNEARRWLTIAGRALARDLPTYVLLQSRDQGRRRRWRKALADERRRLDVERDDRVVSIQNHRGDIGRLAFRLASTSDSAKQDLAIAARHRPALFFATGEPYSTPLNVDRLLESGLMRICANSRLGLGVCLKVIKSEDLENNENHLRFTTDELAEVTRETTMYVHVRAAPRREFLYLDYWWYLPNNPAKAGEGALCGAGFAIAGITCHDHQSDWEGVTVIVKPGSKAEPSEPVAVHYAAHDGRTLYEWKTLIEIWKRLEGRDGKPFESGVDTSLRPLVFVALGTHAAYPEICRARKCTKHSPWRDNRHDGGEPWIGNHDDTPACPLLCALPTRDRGREPARWNAYDGRWGSARCDVVVLCNESNPPRAPGQQGRYKKPWCANRWAEPIGTEVAVRRVERCFPAPRRRAATPRPPALENDVDALPEIRRKEE